MKTINEVKNILFEQFNLVPVWNYDMDESHNKIAGLRVFAPMLEEIMKKIGKEWKYEIISINENIEFVCVNIIKNEK